MAYNKTDWQNLPSTDTPIIDTALDNMETGIEYNDQRLNGTKPINNTVYANDFKCKNLFSSPMETGSLDNSSGATTTDANAIRTANFIPVNSNTDYVVSNENNYHIFIYEYDSNYNFIKYTGGTAEIYLDEVAITTSGTTKYIKIRTAGSYTENNTNSLWMLELGNEASAYTPYKNFDNTEYVLYSNSNPTWQETSYALNDNSLNYEKVILYFSRYGVSSGSVEIYPNLNRYPNCFISYSQGGIVRLYGTTFYLDDNIITISNQYYVNMTGNNTFQMFIETANNISLYKVVGINKINNLPVTSSSLLSIQSEGE